MPMSVTGSFGTPASTAKTCGLGDVCMGAKLSPHGEQWLGQSVAKNTYVNRTFKVKERDEQSQAIAADLEFVRVRVVVESGNHAEEFCEVWISLHLSMMRASRLDPRQRPGQGGRKVATGARWLG